MSKGRILNVDDDERIDRSRLCRHFKLLTEIASQLMLAREPGAVLGSILERVSLHLGLEVYAYYRLEEEQQSLTLVEADGFPAPAA